MRDSIETLTEDNIETYRPYIKILDLHLGDVLRTTYTANSVTITKATNITREQHQLNEILKCILP